MPQSKPQHLTCSPQLPLICLLSPPYLLLSPGRETAASRDLWPSLESSREQEVGGGSSTLLPSWERTGDPGDRGQGGGGGKPSGSWTREWCWELNRAGLPNGDLLERATRPQCPPSVGTGTPAAAKEQRLMWLHPRRVCSWAEEQHPWLGIVLGLSAKGCARASLS